MRLLAHRLAQYPADVAPDFVFYIIFIFDNLYILILGFLFKMSSKYYIEKIDGSKYNFNLWEKDGTKYFNVATLFYDDPIWKDEWILDDKKDSINYTVDEIKDELESPLKLISVKTAKLLLDTISPEEVADEIVSSLEGLLNY
jgi:hypothetical protein